MKIDWKFDYDNVHDSLYIYGGKCGEKLKGSLDIGNFIIDLTASNRVSGLEILDFKEVLKNLGVQNPEEIARNIQSAQLKAVSKIDSIVVYYLIECKGAKIGSSVAVALEEGKKIKLGDKM